jgi:hypothetical protein
VATLPADLKQQPIVMFCTGGIRCEKAGPYMEREGFEQVYQLDGGILKYFEDVGGAHYEGECFVFDQRVGLDPDLSETKSDVCFACLTPLTHVDLLDPRYEKGISCPACHVRDEEQRARTLAMRRHRLREVTSPLPGGVPYDNRRPLVVPAACDGIAVIDFLGTILAHVPREEWEATIASGHLLDCDGNPVAAGDRVRAGERYIRLFPATIEPEVNAAIEILCEDVQLNILIAIVPKA